MNESFWIMQGYEIYIWPSYVLTLLSLGLFSFIQPNNLKKLKNYLNNYQKLIINYLNMDRYKIDESQI